MAVYAASKAAQIGLVKALAIEYGAKGVRVNAILPGGTDTPASITNAPGADAWPLTATNFILMYKQPKDAKRSKAALDFFK